MSQPGLADLANETLEAIMQYIPAKEITENVRNTSRQLNKLSYSNGFWQRYLKFQFDFAPICRRSLQANPMEKALAIEKEKLRWQRNKGLNKFKMGCRNIAAIDDLKIHTTKNGNRLALTGSRDRKVLIWDLKKVAECEDDREWCVDSGEVHKGWIYGVEMADDDKTVFSCGFDYTLRQHELTESGLREIASFDYNQTLMRCTMDYNVLYMTTLKSGIHMIDPRAGLKPQRSCTDKISSLILSVMANDSSRNDLFVAHGKGSPFAQIDKRQFKVLTTLRVSHGGGVSSLDVNNDHLLVSMRNGNVLYFNPTTLSSDFTWKVDNLPNVVKNVNTRSSNGMILYSTAYELSAYMPGRKPQLYGKLESKEMLINMAYKDDDLVAITGDGSVQFWPRETANYSREDDTSNTEEIA
ncbi:unnamed protein product [Bursaphelenchus okinawaensis]|uniref:F-box domain-containing protein n=1 Tax=Bursaphelenchus okinawaensis TaxID=465554 RepID=A0A811K5E0_9BILA|nr:unnamed protein product [Bursaphelenchus okinawaensis]CAG9091610.1 unnamed protein product [Bursaphelenchus okinawaensis]